MVGRQSFMFYLNVYKILYEKSSGCHKIIMKHIVYTQRKRTTLRKDTTKLREICSRNINFSSQSEVFKNLI